MYLNNIQIVNYKNFKTANVNFKSGSNTIIGENDSGKSNLMTALRILLDSSYFFNEKRLRENDFSDAIDDWKGHWIIISACFDKITTEDSSVEIGKDMIPNEENKNFLKSIIRCKDTNYGTVTLFIRPCKSIRKKLFEASDINEFNKIRRCIVLEDYEFYYTTKSQEVFTDSDNYIKIVGDINNGKYANPDDEDTSVLGSKVNILEVWQHLSIVFIDALRDVESDLKKSQNPIRRIIDTIKSEIENKDITTIKDKITDLNNTISNINAIASIGESINDKLQETIGMVYAPEIKIESQIKEDISLLSKHLSMSPTKSQDLDYLGLGHLNMIYIALKLVEFEYNKKRELLNIMIIEEPEAHIHTHIQKTLFENLKISQNYTQVLMTTHSTHLSEVSEISTVNILKSCGNYSKVMCPMKELDEFGKDVLKIKDIPLSKCLERYLDVKRSVLLFSKAVILVEGDGEEILLPSLIKKVLGVTLDELGIGLINIGSVGFENIASIFDEKRLQRKCAIITDLDSCVSGAKKCSSKASDIGISRQTKLELLFKDNNYVKNFYAPHSLEYDFASLKENHECIKQIIEAHYIDQKTKDKHKENLTKSDADRYDTVITIAKAIGKGWYATLLAEYINQKTIIPDYIMDAIAFVSTEVINVNIKSKICDYALIKYDDDNEKIKWCEEYNSKNAEEKIKFFTDTLTQDVSTKFIKACDMYE